MGLAGIDMTHRILDRSLFQEKGSKEKYYFPFEARTNSAVYLGDFVGYAKVNLVAEEWAIKSVTNNFVVPRCFQWITGHETGLFG